jgi:hypothetical protein
MSLSRSLEASRTSLLSTSSRVVTFDALGALAQRAGMNFEWYAKTSLCEVKIACKK